MSKKISPKKAKKELKIIELDGKLFDFADRFSREDIIMALTLALSSKIVLSGDVIKTVKRLMFNKKALESALSLSEDFLLFITEAFIADSKEELLARNK